MVRITTEMAEMAGETLEEMMVVVEISRRLLPGYIDENNDMKERHIDSSVIRVHSFVMDGFSPFAISNFAEHSLISILNMLSVFYPLQYPIHIPFIQNFPHS